MTGKYNSLKTLKLKRTLVLQIQINYLSKSKTSKIIKRDTKSWFCGIVVERDCFRGFHPRIPKPEIPKPKVPKPKIPKIPKYPRPKYPMSKTPKTKIPKIPKYPKLKWPYQLNNSQCLERKVSRRL